MINFMPFPTGVVQSVSDDCLEGSGLTLRWRTRT